MKVCFHCGLPVPEGGAWSVELDGSARPLCCAGCEAVARAIVAAGAADYYRLRTSLPPRGRELVPDFLDQLAVYDHPAIQRTMVRDTGESGELKEAALLLEDLSCAACVWLVEKRVGAIAGVSEFSVNYATRRALVRWNPVDASLSQVLGAIAAIGFTAHPYDRDRAQEGIARERRDRLLRFLVAGVLGMQVMTLAVALYAGAFSGMEEEFRKFFRWTSLLLTAPVLLYSARPFFAGAWRDLAHRRVGMDVPVALGLTLAYAGSVWATVADRGEVYFDSVVMFVFLLLGARLLELLARERAVREQESAVRSVPATARRMGADGTDATIATVELVVGDRVRILPGECIPADGVIEEGLSSLDEALLTGESVPVPRAVGDRVIGGAVNVESPLVVRVTAVGEGTVLSALLGLVEQALAAKPEIARVADRTAQWFVRRILLLAVAVGLYWAWADPSRVLPTVIAVLVVSCPCALSLATPVALAAASGALAGRGFLATRGHAIETLGRADLFVFDKTGTLTTGRLRVDGVEPYGRWGASAVLATAAMLERGSEHPIARAISRAHLAASAQRAADGVPAESDMDQPSDLRNVPGRGLTATLGGEAVALGSASFVCEELGLELPSEIGALADRERTLVVLAGRSGARGAILLDDSLRDASSALVGELRRAGKRVLLLSGDAPGAVRRMAAAAGIDEWEGGASPERKVARVRELGEQGAVVAMIGDGVNDAAALAAAPVSVAMGSGAYLAARAADAVLLSNRPQDLGFAIRHSARAIARVRQNFALAFAYNLVVIPLAAAGRIPPWAAAIGMSASSAAVVLNALRLRARGDRDSGNRAAPAAGSSGERRGRILEKTAS